MASAEPSVECVLDYTAKTGESPTWSVREQVLYWIDVKQPALHRFDPQTHQDRQWLMPEDIGCFALLTDGSGALVALRTGLFRLAFGDGALALLAAAPFDPARFRFNEGACDGMGRFWLGTMYDPKPPGDASSRPLKGRWHSYSEQEGLRAHRHFAVVPNGLAWSADDRALFTSHTRNRIIWVFDYELAAGRLGRRHVFARIPKEHGAPDGCAIDEQGCYWSALNGGSRLRRFRPDGSVDRDVMLPVSRPTMCAFGGAQLDTLYVTTQSEKLSEQERQAQPLAGKLLSLRPGVRGRAPGLFG